MPGDEWNPFSVRRVNNAMEWLSSVGIYKTVIKKRMIPTDKREKIFRFLTNTMNVLLLAIMWRMFWYKYVSPIPIANFIEERLIN